MLVHVVGMELTVTVLKILNLFVNNRKPNETTKTRLEFIFSCKLRLKRDWDWYYALWCYSSRLHHFCCYTIILL